MALKFQKLRVLKVVRESTDAITIYFENPDKSVFAYIPGQYLTLRVDVNGKMYNRAYSLCSCPTLDDNLAVTVKRTTGGIVSTHLNNNLKEGDQIDVLQPMGNFVAKLNPSQKKHYILIGAGSGITPLMSILRTALHTEADSKVTLLYGNRNMESTIFRTSLERLQAEYDGRLMVIHALTQPDSAWTGPSGRLTRGRVKEILGPVLSANTLEKEFYICGPSAMMDEAGHALREMNIKPAQVHQEHFSAPITHPLDEETEPESNEVTTQEVTIIIDGKEKVITVTPNESVLEAALDNDLDPPYACMIGSCCTCKAKLMAGKVVMDDREGLTDEEIREGFVLTCQSHPISKGVILSYDEM